MASLMREERFVFQFGTEEHVLRVQEMLWGPEGWPGPCRILVPASHRREARSFYGATPREVAEKAADYLAGSVSPSEKVPPA